MEKGSAHAAEVAGLRVLTPMHRAYLNFIGRRLLQLIETIQGLGAFFLITLGVILTKQRDARPLIHPLILKHIFRAGLRLLPMVGFLALALGLVIIGQTVFLLNRVGAENLLGTVMVSVVVRELGPLITALVVLARVGAATVIELGTSRALGEVEVLESLAIDPVHYLVMPRVIGMALSIFSLTIYLILIALIGGYGFAFLQDVPLKPMEYLGQLARSLLWQDFALLTLKTMLFGVIISVVTCYHGLAQPLWLEEVAGATTRAMTQSVVACILLDALFLIIYLVI